MNFLKLNSNQYVELVPRCNCSLHDAITESIAFITDNGILGADLIVDGFTMGIYPEDFKANPSEFIHGLQQEYDNYKKLKNESVTQ